MYWRDFGAHLRDTVNNTTTPEADSVQAVSQLVCWHEQMSTATAIVNYRSVSAYSTNAAAGKLLQLL